VSDPDRLDPVAISFRPITAADMVLMHRWLNLPHVQEWYTPEPTTLPEITAKYDQDVRTNLPTVAYLLEFEARPIGFIQSYRLADEPEYAAYVGDGEVGAHGLDLFIGEPEYVHRGLGAPLLRQFLGEIVFGRNGAAACRIDPDPANRAAIRAYEKAGFRHVKTVQIPDADFPSYVMRIGSEDVIGT
jgi:RimJ/RimL family protein N-acetyltransferase